MTWRDNKGQTAQRFSSGPVTESPRLTTNRAIDINAKFHEELRAKRQAQEIYNG